MQIKYLHTHGYMFILDDFVVASYLLPIPLAVSFLYLTLTPRSPIIYSLAHKNFIWAPLFYFLATIYIWRSNLCPHTL